MRLRTSGARTQCLQVWRSRHGAHLVVAGDGDVHVSQGRVGVAERDAGDVDVGGLRQGLMVGTGVSHDQETGLPEGRLDLIGECSRGEAAVEGGGTGGRGELQHGSLESGGGG